MGGEGRATEEEAVIRLVDVHKAFGAQQVLRGLSLDVARGTTLGVMGPSGTGKSVLLRHIVGLLEQDSGQVLVDGQEVSTLSRHDLAAMRRRMGYLFQEGALINWLNVGENVALPLRENTKLPDEEIREKVRDKLELVHIPDTWDKMPSEISGGMKKRVGLARAMITDPEIILYDEPNAGLDPEISRSINGLIRELADRLEVTAIVVEHRIECIRTVCDEVLFLDEGRAVVHERPEAFFSSDHPRLRRFLGLDAATASS